MEVVHQRNGSTEIFATFVTVDSLANERKLELWLCDVLGLGVWRGYGFSSVLVQSDLAFFSRLSSLVAIQVTAEGSFILPFDRNAYNAKVEEGV